MKNYSFIDINYPGVTYKVPQRLVYDFIHHMRGEGAYVKEVSRSPRGNDIEIVVAVREDREYWGLVTK